MNSSGASTVAAVVRFNAQTAARDKICRLVQYISRFLWWWLQKHGYSRETFLRFKKLESAISTARKLFRLGKSIDVLQSAAHTIHHPDLTVRYTVTFSKVNTALFLLFDHIVWGCRVGLLPHADKAYWGRLSNRFWLVSLVACLLRDVHEMKKLMAEQHKRRQRAEEASVGKQPSSQVVSNSLTSRCISLLLGFQDRPQVILDSVKNLCDIFLPLNNLDLIDVSPGLLGLLGSLSSLIGALLVWDSQFKLKPS